MQRFTECRVYVEQSRQNRKKQNLLVLLTGENHLATASISFLWDNSWEHLHINMPSCRIAEEACSDGDAVHIK